MAAQGSDGAAPTAREVRRGAVRLRRAQLGRLAVRLAEIQVAVVAALEEVRQLRDDYASSSDSGSSSAGSGLQCCVCYGSCSTFTRCSHPVCLGCLERLRDNRCPLCRLPLAGDFVGRAPEAPSSVDDPWEDGRPWPAAQDTYHVEVDEAAGAGPALGSETEPAAVGHPPPAGAPGLGNLQDETVRALARQNRRAFNVWLPRGWSVFETDAGERYYAHERLGVQWQAPAGTRPRQ